MGHKRYELYLCSAIQILITMLAHIAWSKSTQGAYLSNCLPPPLQEKPVCRLSVPSEVWLSGWTSLLSPPPPRPPSNPCHTRNSPETICIQGWYWPLIGQVKAACLRVPLPMATVLRDSEGEDKLLHYTSPFSVSNSSHCIVFFSPPPPPPHPPPPPL